MARRSRHHCKAIVPVDRDDVAICQNGESEWVIQRATLRDSRARSRGRVSLPRVWDRCDPVVDTVGDAQRSPRIALRVIAVQAEVNTGRTDDQGGGISSL